AERHASDLQALNAARLTPQDRVVMASIDIWQSPEHGIVLGGKRGGQAAAVLAVSELVALIYGGIKYTTQKGEVDMGPIQINKTEHHNIPIPPLVGIACIAAGGALLFVGGRPGR